MNRESRTFPYLPGLFTCLVLAISPSRGHSQDPAGLRLQLDDLQQRVSVAESNQVSVLEGRDGWLYFVPEIRSLLVGQFWGERATETSRSASGKHVDPLPAILDFRDQLKAIGVDLLLVPVPAKAAAVPEPLMEDLSLASSDWRMDASHAKFLDHLDELNVQVIDLLPEFRSHSRSPETPLYCRTDTHWSGRGIAVAAACIARRIRDMEWFSNSEASRWAIKERTVRFRGDLAEMIALPKDQMETVNIFSVRDAAGSPLPTQPDSPILLLGDSHTLVFHDPALHAQGAGLPDHLALELGMPVDLIGVRGSGGTSARISLARQKSRLRGKKLVIWCFAAREFSESRDGWRKLPIPNNNP
jgi:hypothetical protein